MSRLAPLVSQPDAPLLTQPGLAARRMFWFSLGALLPVALDVARWRLTGHAPFDGH